MILGDSSAWIDHFRNRRTRACRRLRDLFGDPSLVTTDAVVMEVAAGARTLSEQRLIERVLHQHPRIDVEPGDFDQAAAIYRVCRGRGTTPRNLVDCLIAAVAIRVDAAVLHSDRDFDLIARHVPLAVDG